EPVPSCGLLRSLGYFSRFENLALQTGLETRRSCRMLILVCPNQSGVLRSQRALGILPCLFRYRISAKQGRESSPERGSFYSRFRLSPKREVRLLRHLGRSHLDFGPVFFA